MKDAGKIDGNTNGFIDFKLNWALTQTVLRASEFRGSSGPRTQCQREWGAWGSRGHRWTSWADQCAREPLSADVIPIHPAVHTHSCLSASLRAPSGAQDPKVENLLSIKIEHILSGYWWPISIPHTLGILWHLIPTADCSLIWHEGIETETGPGTAWGAEKQAQELDSRSWVPEHYTAIILPHAVKIFMFLWN